MTIGIFGNITQSTDFIILRDFFQYLIKQNVEYFIYDDYVHELSQHNPLNQNSLLLKSTFHNLEELSNIDFIFSIGGDGTLLDCVRMVKRLSIPIIGVNVGRLGFLTSSNQHELKNIINNLINQKWSLQKRTILSLKTEPSIINNDNNFAVNEITIKSNSNEMITIHVYINGEFLNSYWSDGLIISTSTGSTAYSLACGGPIIIPESDTLVLTPIAPHSLTVRPIIVPTNSKITFEVESRSNQFLVTMDNRSQLFNNDIKFTINKADFEASLVMFEEKKYFDTLRNRLMSEINKKI